MPRGGLTELIWDPAGSWFDGVRSRAPYGGHQHVHAAASNPWVMLAIIRRAQRMGMSVRENPFTDPVDPVHTEGSWHDRLFKRRFDGRPLGKAADISGTDADERRLFNWTLRRFGDGSAAGARRMASAGGGGGGRGRSGPSRAGPDLQALLALLQQRPQLPFRQLEIDPRATLQTPATAAAVMAGRGPTMLGERTSSLSADLDALRRQLLAA